MTALNALQRSLSEFYGYDHVVLVGRARSGLVAISEALQLKQRPVLIPSNICGAVYGALHAAGVKVQLVPVSPDTGIANDDRLVACIGDQVGPGLIMPTHLYGQLDDYSRTHEIATSLGWFILENDTLCAARVREGKVPRFGDALLTSFGYSKTASVGSGGAILTNDDRLAAELGAVVSRWPTIDDAALEIERNVMLARRSLREVGCLDLAEGLLDLERNHVCHKFPDSIAPAVLTALSLVEENLDARNHVSQIWASKLERFSEFLLAPHKNVTAPWRLVRRIREPRLRDRIAFALRRNKLDAGINFPELCGTYPSRLGGQTSADGRIWGASVINFWLDPSYTESRISEAVACIGHTIDSYLTDGLS